MSLIFPNGSYTTPLAQPPVVNDEFTKHMGTGGAIAVPPLATGISMAPQHLPLSDLTLAPGTIPEPDRGFPFHPLPNYPSPNPYPDLPPVGGFPYHPLPHHPFPYHPPAPAPETKEINYGTGFLSGMAGIPFIGDVAKSVSDTLVQGSGFLGNAVQGIGEFLGGVPVIGDVAQGISGVAGGVLEGVGGFAFSLLGIPQVQGDAWTVSPLRAEYPYPHNPVPWGYGQSPYDVQPQYPYGGYQRLLNGGMGAPTYGIDPNWYQPLPPLSTPYPATGQSLGTQDLSQQLADQLNFTHTFSEGDTDYEINFDFDADLLIDHSYGHCGVGQYPQPFPPYWGVPPQFNFYQQNNFYNTPQYYPQPYPLPGYPVPHQPVAPERIVDDNGWLVAGDTERLGLGVGIAAAGTAAAAAATVGAAAIGGVGVLAGGALLAPMVIDPVAIDLDGDGKISTTGNSTAMDRFDREVGETIAFDLNGDGVKEQVEWLNGGDGFLVDPSMIGPNGQIDGRALMGDHGGQFSDGYHKMSYYDTNRDGQLTGGELDRMAVWVDRDMDGTVDAGELMSTDQAGLHQMSTIRQDVRNERGEILMQSTANNGSVLTEDVWLATRTG